VKALNMSVHSDGKKYPRFLIKREQCHCGSPRCVGTQQPFVARKLLVQGAAGTVTLRAKTFNEVCEHIGAVIDTYCITQTPPTLEEGGGV